MRSAACCIAMLAVCAQAQERAVIHLGDAPLARSIAPGETHTFEIDLQAGDVLRVRVEQGDINLGVAIRGAGGQELSAANNSGASDVEFVSALAPLAGRYDIEVKPVSTATAPGDYKIAVQEAGPASDRGRALVEGDRLFTLAHMRRNAGTAQANRDAIKGFAEARERYVAADEPWRIAESWNRIGVAQLALNEHRNALASFDATRVIVDRIGDHRWQGVLLNNIGLAHWNLSEVTEALDAHREALAIRREVGDRAGEASTLFNTALVHTGIGEPEKSVALLQETLPLRRLVGDKPGEMRSLTSLANAARATGNFELTFDSLSRALAIAKEQKDKNGEVDVLRSMSSTYLTLGDLAQARQAIEAALAAAQPIGNRRILALMQSQSAEILAADGDFAGALDRLARARAEHRALGGRIDELGALMRLTRIQLQIGDFESARAGQAEAMALAKELNAPGSIASAYELQGSIALAEKRPSDSAAAFQEALAAYISQDDHPGLANARYGLARALRESGEVDTALAEAESALAEIEAIRATVRNSELRASYRERTQRVHELKVDLLMRKHESDPSGGFDFAALVASDTSRARGLLESFGGNLPEFLRDADPALIADRETKGRRVNELERRRALALDVNRIGTAPSTAALSGALREYRDAEAKVFASSPRARALLAPPLTTRETLAEVAGDDAVIVEYALGESRSFAWAVSRSGLASAILPPRSVIEDAAARLFRAVTARNATANDASVDTRRARLQAADREASSAARDLARLIVDPVGGRMAEGRRLVFIVDGALSTVPFAFLPLRGRLLSEDHALALAPSAAMMSALRQPRNPNKGTLAVFADPVFEASDPRVTARAAASASPPASAVPAPPPSALSVSARRDGEGRFPRLAFSRAEAEAITSLVPRNRARTALDFSANRAAARREEIGNASIVHFATHGVVNPAQPELSGLVLSLVDASGRPLEGFLRLHDIYRLHLRADLVVLSACRSAVGRDFKGEGPMALTRGFLVAGAPRVVATLWDVDDRATAELMRLFYEGVLKRREAPAAALRSAQTAMSKIPRWSAPYFWAGFTLTGEWR